MHYNSNLKAIRIQFASCSAMALDLCVCYLAQELPINPVNPDLAMISATRRLLRITLGYVMLLSASQNPEDWTNWSV